MKTVLFEGTYAYLPEIPAYRDFLAKYFPDVLAFDSREKKDIPSCPDIVWRFMGMDFKGVSNGQILVHDYNSLSTQPWARTKNVIKSFVNCRPHYRIFLNEDVRSRFLFDDNIPSSCRDMGIQENFFVERQSPTYDFIYVGSMSRVSVIFPCLDAFVRNMKGKTFALVGEAGQDLIERYKDHKNIIFVGRVPYSEIPQYLAKSNYALNLMPDIYPFNLQTSTKMLEYCAAGMKVISSSYHWAQKFSAERNAEFFWLNPNFSNFTLDALESFAFHTPDVRDLTWENVISNSRVFDFLRR